MFNNNNNTLFFIFLMNFLSITNVWFFKSLLLYFSNHSNSILSTEIGYGFLFVIFGSYHPLEKNNINSLVKIKITNLNSATSSAQLETMV